MNKKIIIILLIFAIVVGIGFLINYMFTPITPRLTVRCNDENIDSGFLFNRGIICFDGIDPTICTLKVGSILTFEFSIKPSSIYASNELAKLNKIDKEDFTAKKFDIKLPSEPGIYDILLDAYWGWQGNGICYMRITVVE